MIEAYPDFRMGTKSCLLTIFLIDVLSLGFTAPYVANVSIVRDPEGVETCQENWEGPR